MVIQGLAEVRTHVIFKVSFVASVPEPVEKLAIWGIVPTDAALNKAEAKTDVNAPDGCECMLDCCAIGSCAMGLCRGIRACQSIGADFPCRVWYLLRPVLWMILLMQYSRRLLFLQRHSYRPVHASSPVLRLSVDCDS